MVHFRDIIFWNQIRQVFWDILRYETGQVLWDRGSSNQFSRGPSFRHRKASFHFGCACVWLCVGLKVFLPEVFLLSEIPLVPEISVRKQNVEEEPPLHPSRCLRDSIVKLLTWTLIIPIFILTRIRCVKIWRARRIKVRSHKNNQFSMKMSP